MSALLFGSISTVADTSELQREAFNTAFEQHGLDWQWGHDDYVEMLGTNGGKDRISAYAEMRGEDVDAEAVHATKSEIFQRRLGEGAVAPREGVAETVAAAREAGYRVALVTTTSPANVTALTRALHPHLDLDAFDLVVDSSKVEAPKPDKAAYVFALEQLGEQPGDCVAVEDNAGGVLAATVAGIPCVAFPNENTAGFGFHEAVARVDVLDFAELVGHTGPAAA